MSGVIDENGQWEHCSICGTLYRMEDLGYIKPSEEHKYGLDVCMQCVNQKLEAGTVVEDDIIPSNNWEAEYEAQD